MFLGLVKKDSLFVQWSNLSSHGPADVLILLYCIGFKRLRLAVSVCFLAEMVACTLDYKWHHYVIASLVSLFGGVVILLPIRFSWQVLERRRWRRRRTRRPVTVGGLQYTLCRMQSSAQGILAGNSTVNKIIVSSFLNYHHHHDYHCSQLP